MTTFGAKEVRCSLCGAVRTQQILTSTNTFGSPDLDNRPPEMKRSTMAYWTQECNGCGYVAYDLTAPVEEAIARLVGGQEYRSLWQDEQAYPPLANRFLRESLLAERGEGDLLNAGMAALHAAWSCDDAVVNDAAPARECRLRADRLIEAGLRQSDAATDQSGYWFAIRTDLLRRAGEFEKATALCAEALSHEADLEPIIASLLHLQERLIAQRDTAAHTLAELEP